MTTIADSIDKNLGKPCAFHKIQGELRFNARWIRSVGPENIGPAALASNSIEFLGVYSDGREPVERTTDLVSIQPARSDTNSRRQAAFPATCKPEPSGAIREHVKVFVERGIHQG
jgi:hypothetical protein